MRTRSPNVSRTRPNALREPRHSRALQVAERDDLDRRRTRVRATAIRRRSTRPHARRGEQQHIGARRHLHQLLDVVHLRQFGFGVPRQPRAQRRPHLVQRGAARSSPSPDRARARAESGSGMVRFGISSPSSASTDTPRAAASRASSSSATMLSTTRRRARESVARRRGNCRDRSAATRDPRPPIVIDRSPTFAAMPSDEPNQIRSRRAAPPGWRKWAAQRHSTMRCRSGAGPRLTVRRYKPGGMIPIGAAATMRVSIATRTVNGIRLSVHEGTVPEAAAGDCHGAAARVGLSARHDERWPVLAAPPRWRLRKRSGKPRTGQQPSW